VAGHEREIGGIYIFAPWMLHLAFSGNFSGYQQRHILDDTLLDLANMHVQPHRASLRGHGRFCPKRPYSHTLYMRESRVYQK
jgi:hypothetical protein